MTSCGCGERLLVLVLAVLVRAYVLMMTCWISIPVIAERVFALVINPRGFFVLKPRLKPPACGEDPKYGTHHLARVNGISLHYVANGKRSSPMMLLVHGFPESWYSWRYQLAAFADEYYVVAPDMRGYGASSKPSGAKNYLMPNMVEDLRALIEHLGYEQVVLVSHDWGAAISWEFTHKYPSLVSRFVVMDNPPNMLRWKSMISGILSLTTWYNFFFQIPWLPEFFLRTEDMIRMDQIISSWLTGVRDKKVMTPDDVEMFKYLFSQDGAWTYPLNYYRGRWSYWGIVANLHDVFAAMRTPWRIRPKTLILWGGNDIALPSKLAYQCQAYCRDSRVKIFPGASHWLQQDQPEKVNAEIRDFLKE